MDFWAFTISISIKFVLSPYFVRAGSNVLKLALMIKNKQREKEKKT